MRNRLAVGSSLHRHRAPLTWFALAAFLWGAALPVLETHEVADPDQAAFQPLAPGGGSLRIDQAPTTEDTPEHCIFCHWQRAVSGAMVSETATIAAPCVAHSRCRLVASRLTAFAFSSHSSRAPPLHA